MTHLGAMAALQTLKQEMCSRALEVLLSRHL